MFIIYKEIGFPPRIENQNKIISVCESTQTPSAVIKVNDTMFVLLPITIDLEPEELKF